MSRHLALVYGSLKQGYWNHRLLAQAKFLGTGITVSDGFSMYDGAFPYVVPDGLNRVKGEVYEVDDNTLANLDRLEGVPSHYVRKEVEVHLFSEEPEIPGINDIQTCNMYVASPRTAPRVKQINVRVSPDQNNICEWNSK